MGSFNKGKEDLMNLQTITATNAIGVTMMIVLQTSSYLIRQRRLPSDRVFTAMILITSAGCATETISFMADGRTFPGAHTISVITCTLLYALNVTLSYMWCIYVDLRLYKQESRLKKYYTRLAIPTIILLRISAVLKRSAGTASVQTYSGLQVNDAKGSLTDGTRELALTKNEMIIFRFMLDRKGEIVTRDELMTALWDNDEFVNDNALTVNISRLRSKLAELGCDDAIETRKKQGYILR